MSKGHERAVRRVVFDDDDEPVRSVVPIVFVDELPRVRIYDPVNDGTFWFSRVGFNRKITDEDS